MGFLFNFMGCSHEITQLSETIYSHVPMEPSLVMTWCVDSWPVRFVTPSLHFGTCCESWPCSWAGQGHPRDPGTQGMVGEPVQVWGGIESVWMGSSLSCHSGEARLWTHTRISSSAACLGSRRPPEPAGSTCCDTASGTLVFLEALTRCLPVSEVSQFFHSASKPFLMPKCVLDLGVGLEITVDTHL